MLSRALNLIFILLVLIISVSCSGYSITGGPGKTVSPSLQPRGSNPLALRGINSLLLAPIVYEQRARNGEQNAAQLYAELVKIIGDEIELELFAPEVITSRLAEPDHQFSQQELVELARSSQADGILITRIYTLQERVGSAIGASEGARVGFVMSVLKTSDLKEVWKVDYFFEDQALSENLFELGKRMQSRQGRGWLTAQQIMANGFQAAGRDFTEKRLAAFQGA